MQKLRERRFKTDTPTDAPQVCSSVALCRSDAGNRTMYRPALNSPKREGDSVVSLETSLNNLDAAQTPEETYLVSLKIKRISRYSKQARQTAYALPSGHHIPNRANILHLVRRENRRDDY